MLFRFRSIVVFLAPLAAVLVDCASLEKLAPDACGNGVIDALEDCDTFPDDKKAQCGRPTAGPSACRLLCGKQKNGDVLACPDGWGCSVSLFCRQPTGTFEPAAEPVSAGVTTMLVGDFDGDGRKDLLGSSGPSSKGRIHYFRDVGAPQVANLPGVLGSPVIYDFDGDGRSDVAFGYGYRGDGTEPKDARDGLAILLGQPDRSVVMKLFPTITAPSYDALVVLLRARPQDLPGGGLQYPGVSMVTLQLKDGTRPSVLRSIGDDPTDFTKGYAMLLPGAIADVPGLPIGERLLDGTVCGEVVVPLNTPAGARILVYSPCQKAPATDRPEWSRQPPKEIVIDKNIDPIFAADVDGDLHTDLIIGLRDESGRPAGIKVAFGTGTAFDLRDAPADLIEVPLAAGHLDEDERIDFVVPSGLLLSSGRVVDKDAGADSGADSGVQPRALTWTAVRAPTKRWTVAQIGDVNHDDHLDVIAASRYEPDVDVLGGTGTRGMAAYTIPTTGSVTHLEIDDFDFDGTSDVGFVQARPASTEREVGICYGRPLTMPPEAPRSAGRLDGIRQLISTRFGLTITSTSKPNDRDLPTFALAQLLKSAERQPVAPLLFAPPNDQAVLRELATRALVVAPGPGPGEADLVALVSKSEYVSGKRSAPSYGVWTATGKGLVFEAPVERFTLPGLAAVNPKTNQFLIQLTSADLDGDKAAELVGIAPDETGTKAALLVIRPGPGTSGLPRAFPIPDRSAPGRVQPLVLDVDGDGKLDFVSILASPKALGVNVFFGDGKASFAIPGTLVALPIPAGASADDFAALGFTQITTGAEGGVRRELAIVTPKHVFRAFVTRDRVVEVSDVTPIFGSIGYGSAIAAGDFDGDGVEDLAIADKGSIRIARQKARLP